MGTLKILLTQGATWKEILYGRALGLFSIAFLFYFPFILCMAGILLTEEHSTPDDWTRMAGLSIGYLLYIATLSLCTIIVSANSQKAKSALVKLLGIWLLLIVILPAIAQALGTYFYPTPNKLEFRSAIEEEIIQFGDSHDPDDPYYQGIRDSVLSVHNVKSVKELPFNYGGFQMGLGEKISTEIYNKHHGELLNQYRQQNQLTKWLAIINPYLGIKNLSMTLSGTDLESYIDFQNKTEAYRYKLAQTMNELQMKYIKANVSSSEGKVNVLDRKTWTDFPDFSYEHPMISQVIGNEFIAIIALLIWVSMSFGIMNYWSKKASAF